MLNLIPTCILQRLRMNYLFIFLGNKLISCDTILPFVIDLKKQNPNLKVIFYTYDLNTLNIIRKNINLLNFINSCSRILLFGFLEKRYFKLIRVFSKAINIFIIIFLSLIYKVSNIHFRSLDTFPFNLIYFFNRKHTYIFESNCWGYSEQVYKADLLFYKNRVGSEQEKFIAYKNLVYFSEEWPQYKYALEGKKNIFHINPTRSNKSWLEECSKQARLLENEENTWYSHLKGSNSKAIVYVLGYMGKIPTLHKDTNGEDLFKETIKFLIEETDLIIFLKPHAITDLKIIKHIITSYDPDRVFIVYNHIAVISHFCDYAVSNYFSYGLADAWSNGCKVIEYSYYDPEVLKMTKNLSIVSKYVDVFINKDLMLFKDTLNVEFHKKNREFDKLIIDDKKALMNRIID